MKPRIFVCQPIPPVAIERLREHGEVEVFPFAHREISIPELEAGCRNADYLFCMHQTPITASMVEANPELIGIGVSHRRDDVHDLDAVEASGIKILEAERSDAIRNGNGRATADLMVSFILALAYRLVEADRYCRGNGYFQEMTMDLMGVGCEDKTVSLIGLGRVAEFAVPRLQAFGFHVLYTKRNRFSPEREAELGVEWVADRDELIARGDFVSMCASFEGSNVHLMGAREFGLMKPSAFFINIGRGRLVDEEAMIEALQTGAIAGAGLDVFWHEPPVQYDAYIPKALRDLDNVILTPHNGGATWDSRGRQTLAVAEAIVSDIVARQPLPTT
jgi:glyoxylate reductase